MKALVISGYEVLHGNPETPTSDTEVLFTYTCAHCNLEYTNGWNSMNSAHPYLFETGAKTSWKSEDSGVTWQRHWSLDE